MKKKIILIGLSAILAASCTSLENFEALEHRHETLRRDYNTKISEIEDLTAENAELQRRNQSLEARNAELAAVQATYNDTIESLHRQMANMQMGFDTVIENYSQQLTGQSRDLNRTNNLLAARTQELNEKEAAFRAKEVLFQEEERNLKEKQAELEAKEAATRKALEAKQQELENLRTKLNNALVGFADKGLNVETRDGKVYVSMDSKLLFTSGSWTVSKEGIEAIQTLAQVLEQNTDLNIQVEGHTDNAAYKGSSGVKDNWDLSVMRATSIVKQLLKSGPGINPSRIVASGHGEFSPKVPNDTPANKALNRRTEIILVPNVGDILKMIE